jgi:hypothetical protein
MFMYFPVVVGGRPRAVYRMAPRARSVSISASL